MNRSNKLGIWMDHTTAHLIEFTTDPPMETIIIVSNCSNGQIENHSDGHHSAGKPDLPRQLRYYEKLSAVIQKYEEVIIFGPPDAKVELYNSLNSNENFAGIRIRIKNAPKMSPGECHSFVREYFLES